MKTETKRRPAARKSFSARYGRRTDAVRGNDGS
jgi:hypothetical protein